MATSKMFDMEKETLTLWRNSRCSVCQLNQKDILIMDCKHTCVCASCIKSISRCPICYGHIKSSITLSFRMEHVNDPSAKIRNDPITKMRNETLDLWVKRLCKLCGKEEKSVMIMDCGHLCICQTCQASALCCPICNVKITETVQIFY